MTLPFENDTGSVIKKLASRSIQTDKRRNLFVIVTIALAAALMAAIFVQEQEVTENWRRTSGDSIRQLW